MSRLVNRKFAILAASLLLAGCHNTMRPVYDGLLADGMEPKPSSRRMPEIKAADGVVIVLSQSTRNTVKHFKENVKSGGGFTVNVPTDKWIADIASPVKQLNTSVRIARDLASTAPGNWVVVLHWTMIDIPIHSGAAVEYHAMSKC
jgi:hypothetical protein